MNYFISVFSILLLSVCSAAKAQSVFITDSGEVTFYSYALLENITANNKSVNGLINIVNGEVAFMIPMRSFRFAKALMQEHFNEKYIESDKYPQATFKGNFSDKPDFSKPGMYEVTAQGTLTIHGVSKEIREKGKLRVDNGSMELTSKFFVALEDYNIKKPSLLFNNIADTIEVNLKAHYIPFIKK
jgi:polyisoprenoid-binding protein YceI